MCSGLNLTQLGFTEGGQDYMYVKYELGFLNRLAWNVIIGLCLAISHILWLVLIWC